MGFKQEAEAYMAFIMDRLKYNKTNEGGLPIMFSIHGHTHLPEVELTHLEGYRGASPFELVMELLYTSNWTSMAS